MKNRNRNLNSSTGKLLNVDSKAKIYVPISIN